MLELLRKYGTPAWITDSLHFAEFLDLTYGANFHGEIWLYNNDLEIIDDSNSFKTLYLNGIFGKHWKKVGSSPEFVHEVRLGKVSQTVV